LARLLLVMTQANRGLAMMNTPLEQLLREADDARLEEAVLEATGDDILDRAKGISQMVAQTVRRVAELTPSPSVTAGLPSWSSREAGQRMT
jgi:hypothetical protein